ncbi:alpha-hydroxy-acid oxidizing protein [Alicyclobacillus sp. SO9]|uniref:alpha-hydroxy-acid oxidizing protein n=1 Tax=Alicyclobacillus sp. SO9 TaxID=2665646 RepID=UPI0018E851A7|nr:alpha-hydroxy-acid oxidizing protein [Alicyclobacillus sp. SO9]QQE80047.1 alpha-hydroxy-acid oxidizing protein [Alicyclobacillus sp. SO9]
MTQYGYEAELRIYSSALKGVSKWPWPVTSDGWREEAKQRLDAGPFGYVDGGAGMGQTMRHNRSAFERYAIQSRMLSNVETRDLSVRLLEQDFPTPLLLAPIGVQSIIHKDAELASAKAAYNQEVPFILSTVSSFTIEEIAKVMGEGVRWFQLYPGTDKDIIRSFITRAEQAGYSALVVTVDTTMLGWRPQDLSNVYLPFLQGEGVANFMSDPAFLSRLDEPPQNNPSAAIEEFLKVYVNPAFSWDDLEELRTWTKLPILVKGITHPEDARQAQFMGMDGVIVSNHGGRQVDGGIAAIDALSPVRQAVGPDYLLLMDSGIRCAADVYKAIALGAKAVLLGRPYAYALGVGGQEGVEELLMQWKAELDLQLALSGFSKVREINSTYVSR